MTRRPGRPERVVPRDSVHEDVERELEAHLALRADELVAQGWERPDAEREARRLFGDRASVARATAEIVRSHQRAVRRAKMWESLMQDLRYGLRTVLRSPGFATVAVVTLALGIGANAAIFSVVHGVLLSPLPFEEPEELVVVREARRQGGTMAVAWANFADWREQSSVFEGLFAYGASTTTVLGGPEPVTASVAVVSEDVWSVLRVTPARGRLTVPADHDDGAAPVAVVSERFWRDALGAPEIASLALAVNGVSATVVGVVPADFDFPTGSDLWMPIELLGQSSSRSAHNWQVVARLGPGVTRLRAETEIDALTQRIVSAEGAVEDDFLAVGAVVRPLQETVVGEARAPLLILFGAAGLVLLVACTNLASTLLARGSNRMRELAVRASLGAGPRRLMRQLLTESVVLAALGAIVGLALASVTVDALRRLGPAQVPRLDEIGVDVTVVLFTAAAAGVTVILFGLLPSLRLARGQAVDVLRSGSRGNAGGGGVGWTALVGTEVALALTLLVGSGLLVRSFRSMLSEDPGFDAADVVSTRVTLSLLAYDEDADHVRFYERVLAELEASPAVRSAGVLSVVPLAGFHPNGRIELDGDIERQAVAGYAVASAGAFEALDIPLLQGRHFADTDQADAPHVAIVSESFAREHWPETGALGRQVTGGGMDNFWEERRFARVVGVVGDVRFESLGEAPVPTVYFPYTQRPFRLRFGGTVLVESEGGDPAAAGPVLRETLQSLDPDVPVELATQEALIDASMAARAFSMFLLVGFAGVALVLAVVGIYGVVSYSVARRTREMGIRLALGADPGGVVRLVMVSATRMVLVGLAAGVVGATLAGRVMRGMLYGIAPMDPVAVTVAVAILGGCALLASWVPAALGTRVDPMVTMRSE